MKRKGLTRLFLALLMADLILVLVLVWGILRTNMPRPSDKLAVRAGVEADTPIELAAEKMALLASEAMNHVSMTGEIRVRGGRARLLLENNAQSDCALTFTLRLIDGETLLQTGLIDPGYSVKEMDFDSELQPGEYGCLAQFQFYELSTALDLGQVGRHVLLIIED